MKSLTKKAYAKINISLDIVGKRDDGYHLLESIMQTVSLYDEVTVTQGGDGISLSTNYNFLPTNEKNIAVKAAGLFFEKAGFCDNICIDIQKRIPVGAGLGGGSADAAAVLRILNEMYDYPLSKEELLELGLKCGADVPFCILGGTRLCSGIGEQMSPLPPLPECFILILKPAFSISTKAVYQAFDFERLCNHPDTKGIIRGLENSSLDDICVRLYNVLETPAIKFHPKIDEYKQLLKVKRACGRLMSGSGSTVFGIFKSRKAALLAQEYFKNLKCLAFITTPVTEDKLL